GSTPAAQRQHTCSTPPHTAAHRPRRPHAGRESPGAARGVTLEPRLSEANAGGRAMNLSWIKAIAGCVAGIVAAVPLAAQEVTVFRDVALIPMDTPEPRVLEGRSVVVRGERIEVIGPTADVAVPAGARVIEGDGRYLLPGLAEMHAHVP